MEDIGAFHRKYFSALLDMMKRVKIWAPPKTPSSQQFQIIYSWPGGKDIAVNILKRKEIRVDLTLKSDQANEEYLALEKDKNAIETVIGKELEWNPTPPTERQIIWRLNNTDPTDESDWPRQHAWLAARLVAFRLAFGPRIEAWQS
jgi:Domain of unknown function (DUF4268)